MLLLNLNPNRLNLSLWLAYFFTAKLHYLQDISDVTNVCTEAWHYGICLLYSKYTHQGYCWISSPVIIGCGTTWYMYGKVSSRGNIQELLSKSVHHLFNFIYTHISNEYLYYWHAFIDIWVFKQWDLQYCFSSTALEAEFLKPILSLSSPGQNGRYLASSNAFS